MSDNRYPVFDRTILEGLHRQYCEQSEKSLIQPRCTRPLKPTQYNLPAEDYDLSNFFQTEQSEANIEDPASSTEIDLSSVHDVTNKSKEEQQLHEEHSWKLLIHTYRRHIQQLEQEKKTHSS